MYARNEHFTTHLVPEAHKYEQNKTGNTDTDYEYINTTIIILFLYNIYFFLQIALAKFWNVDRCLTC